MTLSQAIDLIEMRLNYFEYYARNEHIADENISRFMSDFVNNELPEIYGLMYDTIDRVTGGRFEDGLSFTPKSNY